MYLLIVTGLSGAGKSQALRKLEDMGYFCVDNLPGEMLGNFAALCERADPPIEKAALGMDSRAGVFHYDSKKLIAELDKLEIPYDILFLECQDQVLERRYQETRRRHPLSGPDSIRDGIRQERDLMQGLRDHATYIVDTTDMRPLELSRKIEALLKETDPHPFTLYVMSFGYKRGVPFEADMVFDMRFCRNPFYEPELRHLSGQDQPIRDYVMSDERVRRFFDGVEQQLLDLIPGYEEQGKRSLMVGFGCTGGRHRSVCAAEEMYARMKAHGYEVRLVHRDFQKEAAEIGERFRKEEK